MTINPVTRQEQLMNAVAEGSGPNIVPVTREEMFLAKAAGQDVETHEPITRKEMLLNKIAENSGCGGGGGVVNSIRLRPGESPNLGSFSKLGEVFVIASDTGSKIDDHTFKGKDTLSSISTDAKALGRECFAECECLSSFDAPYLETVGESAFAYCSVLIRVDMPKATFVGESAFYLCNSIENIRLPNATFIDALAFGECSALSSLYLPLVKTINTNACYGCYVLKVIDLPSVTEIKVEAFAGCTALSTLILRTTETVCSVDVTAILGTKILTEEGMPTGEGFIYIPTSMDAAYRAAYEPVFEELGAAGLYDILFRKIEDWPEICG